MKGFVTTSKPLELVQVVEAAELLFTSPGNIRILVHRNRLHYVVGKLLLKSEVLALLERRRYGQNYREARLSVIERKRKIKHRKRTKYFYQQYLEALKP